MSLTTWTNEQIKGLAADHLLMGAAETTADPRKWDVLGTGESTIWGEFSNSNKPPYHTAARLPHLAFSCNCPSRKFPCQHAISLALMATRQPGAFSPSQPPSWVEALWASESPTPADPSSGSQAARRAIFQRRLHRVQSALDEYALWLRDMVHTGLAELPKKPAAYWVSMANRLADSGAGTLAAQVRQLQSITSKGEAWPDIFLRQIGRHYLITQAFTRYATFSGDNQADLRYAAGWLVDPDDKHPEEIRDRWLVLGGRQEINQGESVQLTWLWGREQQRFAQLSRPFPRHDPHFQPFFINGEVDAALNFLPGANRLRAELHSLHEFRGSSAGFPAEYSLKNAQQTFGRALSRNPWLDNYPFALQAVDVFREQEIWWLRDEEGCRWSLPENFIYGWHLAALLNREPGCLFGEWNGRFFTPLTLRENGRWLPLHILQGLK